MSLKAENTRDSVDRTAQPQRRCDRACILQCTARRSPVAGDRSRT